MKVVLLGLALLLGTSSAGFFTAWCAGLSRRPLLQEHGLSVWIIALVISIGAIIGSFVVSWVWTAHRLG